MIWGMTLEPGKLYTEIMAEEVQLSLAAIDSRKELGESSNSFCQIMMKTSKSEYVLCTLVNGVMFQQSLDLKLMPREKVTFSVQGPNVVYLMGYTASYPEDVEMILEGEREEGLDSVENSASWEHYDGQDGHYIELKRPDGESIIKKPAPHQAAVTPGARETGEDPPVLGDASQNGQQSQDKTGQPTNQDDHASAISSPGAIVKMEVRGEAPSEQEEFYSNQTTSQLPETHTAQGEQYTEEFYYPEGQVPPTATGLYHQPGPPSTLPQAEIVVETTSFVQPQGDEFGPSLQVGTSTSGIMAPLKTTPSPRRQHRPSRGRGGRGARSGGLVRSAPRASPQHLPPGPSTSSGTVRGKSGHHYRQPELPAKRTPPRAHAPGGQPTADPQLGDPSTATRILLQLQQRTGHPKDPRRVGYLCKFCSRGFSRLGHLEVHERVHTREQPFKCKLCARAFSQTGNLYRHERSHFKIKKERSKKKKSKKSKKSKKEELQACVASLQELQASVVTLPMEEA